jgi:glycosyltransferase involved in cell wall biosynthesis
VAARESAPVSAGPTVSVLVPAWNRLAYLRPCVESVLAQTFTDWELIIADDGSDAGTRDWLETLRDHPRIKLLFLAHTGNPGAVRNAAAREARGEWLAFLDSDDVWLADKLELQLAAMHADASRHWGYGAVDLIDPTGKVMPAPPTWKDRFPQGDILEEVIRWRAGIPMPTVIVRRGLFIKVGGFDEAHPMFEDFDLWFRLAHASGAVAVESLLAHVRLHGEHYSWRGERAFREWIGLFERWKPRFTARRLQCALEAQCVWCTVLLALDQAAAGDRVAALHTYFSRRNAWRHLRWWTGALRLCMRCVKGS